MFWKQRRVYLDHAATTPMDARVISVMNEIWKDGYWNPGSITREGVQARGILKDARAQVARELSAQPAQIYFTHDGTDSINRAILGAMKSFKLKALSWKGASKSLQLEPDSLNLPHIITSTIEHPAVLETIQELEKRGECTATYLSVNEKGLIDPDAIKKALIPETVLVSIQYANNEIGTIQPIREIAKVIRQWRKQGMVDSAQRIENPDAPYVLPTIRYPLFHTDTIQAANYLDLHVDRLGVDLLSLSGSKIYGPKNSGILYVRNRETIEPITFGGGQEGGLVVGTEDVANVAGFAEALGLVRDGYEKESKRLEELRDFLIGEVMKIEGVVLNGVDSRPLTSNSSPSGEEDLKFRASEVSELPPLPRERAGVRGQNIERLPNNAHFSVAGIISERLVLELDSKGFVVSSKSACKTDREGASHVMKAITKLTADSLQLTANLRITLGRSTTKNDLIRFVKVFHELVSRIRKEKI